MELWVKVAIWKTAGWAAGRTSRNKKIVRLQNNLIIKQFQFRKENDVLVELEERLRSLPAIESADTVNKGQSRREIGECLKLLQKMKKEFGEGLTLLERDAFKLQEEILSLRMLPLELILGSLGKANSIFWTEKVSGCRTWSFTFIRWKRFSITNLLRIKKNLRSSLSWWSIP